jgi:RNA polymerase sigma-32 factor
MPAQVASRSENEETLVSRPRAKKSAGGAEPIAGGPFSQVLGYYVTDLKRHAPISREEEHELAVDAQKGDRKAAERLLTSNLRLVVKIARDYRHAQVPLQDLVQEGNLGLVIAVRKFDPSRGVKLSTYGAWWIRAYILKFILDNSRLVRWGTTQAQRKLFFSLRKEQRKLAAQDIDPSAALLSEMLHVPEHAVVEMDRRLSESELSLDAPTQRDDEGSRSLMDRLPSVGQALPDGLAEERELLERLNQSLARFRGSLDVRDQHILSERILSESPDTLERIGARYRISRERARQLEERLSKKLEIFLEENIVGNGRDLHGLDASARQLAAAES